MLQHKWRFLDNLQPARIVWADNLAHEVFHVPKGSFEDARLVVRIHNDFMDAMCDPPVTPTKH
jgi:hypothetical protein